MYISSMKSLKTIYSALLFLVVSICPVFADNVVRSVKVNVMLDSLGNARISEVWDVNIDSNNTEWYLSLSNLGNGRIRNLAVRDLFNDQKYTPDMPWDVNRTREQKAGRYGLIEKGSDSYELCWGVTANGDHLWEVSYNYDNLIIAFEDSCAFNHMFISDGLSTPPQKARVEISYPGKEITDFNASIWAFGFDGYVAYKDGIIVAESDGALTQSEGLIVMAAFDKELFNSSNTSEDYFKVMKDLAFKESSYLNERTPLWQSLLMIVVFIFVCIAGYVIYLILQVLGALALSFFFFTIIPVVWATLTLYPLRKYFKKRKLLHGKQYTRLIPEGRDLTHVPYILDEYSYNILSTPSTWDDKITAAYLMRLIAEDAIYIDKNATENGVKKPLLHVRKGWKLEPDKYSEADSSAMNSLYKLIKEASGLDFILQSGELKEYKKKEGLEYVKEYYSKRKLSNFKINNDEAVAVLGLEAYLKDFTIMSEREIPEMALWNEYMVYATVFGVADKVLKQMKKIAPDYPVLDRVFDENDNFLLDGAIIRDVRTGMSFLHDKAQPKSSSSGSNGYGGYSSSSSGGGGRSSHGGGGGHSGGGGGGGR